jgi:integrase
MYFRNVSRDLGTAADRAGLNGEARERASKLPRRQRERAKAVETDRPLLTTHDLRHSAISRWIAAGIDPVTVARWAGDDLQTILSTYAGDFDLAKRRVEQRRLLELGTAIRIAP